jgi:hypothetical protein
MTPLTAALLFGLALGTRHAFEPDHLAAVSVLSSDGRGPRHGWIVGAIWGVGHTLALLVVGTVLALSAGVMPPMLSDAFEFTVAIMLVVLGVNACVRAARMGHIGPHHTHAHGRVQHVHSGPQEHVHLGPWTLALRPLLVGMLHGLAGSGALTALVMATLPGTAARLLYIALFGFGSVLGMTAISGIASWPLAQAAQKASAARWVRGAAGLFSTFYGLLWGWPVLVRLLS